MSRPTPSNSPGRKLPEILAPAGSEESFQAALASGAGAVYLGLSEGFNARRRSTAFGLSNLPSLVERAHRAGVRLYVTVNTLVFEDELEGLERLLRGIAKSDVDALIVQDPATAFVAKAVAPELRLHASTQMTISSPEGAQFAATLKMDRVVLPRELSAHEIARFHEESDMEAEVFVHGALCMAWSGQCLTSEAFSDRSANRGQCSQACRMPYEAVVDGEVRPLGDQRYLLSPQDLAAHEVLPDLIEAGVSSLKIEGRYKGAPYVTAAVDSWRSALAAHSGSMDHSAAHEKRDKSQLTYSRGGSVGFLQGDNHQELVVGTTPKHRGLPLGTVEKTKPQKVLVRLSRDAKEQLLRPGVGVKFEQIGRAALDVENAPGGPVFGCRKIEPQLWELSFGTPGPDLRQVRAGDEVRLTGDPEVVRDAEKRSATSINGRLPLSLKVIAAEGQPLVVQAEADSPRGPLKSRASSESLLQAAHRGGLSSELIEDKLGSLGSTAFQLSNLDVHDLQPGLHLPVSELKRLRRTLVEQLEQQLREPRYAVVSTNSCLPALRERLSTKAPAPNDAASLIPLFRTEEQLDAWIAAGPHEESEVELDWMEMVGLTRAVQKAKEAGLRVTLATVRVQKPGEEAYDRRISKLQPEAILLRHWGGLMHFAKKQQAGEALKLHGDFSLNVTNSLTANHLLGLGLSTVTASHDLNRPQLLNLLDSTPRGTVSVTLHHHIPTFHNSHCVYAHLLSDGKDYRDCGRPCEKHRMALRDYAGHEHPMVVDVSCRNTMFNAKAQSAAPLVPQLLEKGVQRFRVEFVWETGAEVTRTLRAYEQLLAGKLDPKEALRIAAVSERYGVTTLRRKGT